LGLDDHIFYIHLLQSFPFQNDVWRQFSAIHRNAQHYHSLLFFVATSSYCDIFVTFLSYASFCRGAFQSTPEFGQLYQFVEQCRNAAAID
jgi:hypothetical protein